jgi:hypothetical protein
VTIQDASAAVLLRLPSGGQVPGVGRRLRVTGEIGTYYGAPQLEAADAPHDLGREGGSPIVLHRAPVASDEWRLVRVTVRITNVSRSGDTWRADASMGAGGSLPISGIAASRLPSTALVEGRGATITGIVKRAYPTASDQRFSVVPRGPSDIQLAADPGASPSPGATATPPRAGATPPGASASPSDGGHTGSGSGSPSGSGVPGGSPGPSVVPAAPFGAVDATIAALPGLVGERVRVAGTVSSVDGPLATIDDGTGQVIVRAPGPLDSGDAPIVSGDVINVVGYVSERDVGGLEVVVSDRADVVRAPALGVEAGSTGRPSQDAALPPEAAQGASASPGNASDASASTLLSGLLVGLTVTGAVASGGLFAVFRRRRNVRPEGPQEPENRSPEGPDPPPQG